VARHLWWLAAILLSSCATNPYDAATDQAARLVGKRAIVHPELRMKEFVYFMQLNKLDLRDRWGDYPHDIYLPPGNNKLLVVCEWYDLISAAPVAKAVRQVKQRFALGHEYAFRSEPSGDGICETDFEDLTLAQRKAVRMQKASANKTLTEKKSSSSILKAKKSTRGTR
jgi:hypothetical protein